MGRHALIALGQTTNDSFIENWKVLSCDSVACFRDSIFRGGKISGWATANATVGAGWSCGRLSCWRIVARDGRGDFDQQAGATFVSRDGDLVCFELFCVSFAACEFGVEQWKRSDTGVRNVMHRSWLVSAGGDVAGGRVRRDGRGCEPQIDSE